MTLIIYATDFPQLKKWGHKISVRDLQIFLGSYLSNFKDDDVVLYQCGNREEILKGPFVTPAVVTDRKEIVKVLENYSK